MTKLILVVDDEFAIRDMMEALLTEEGYTVQSATNGQHGLATLSEGRPDLILSDWMMPVMDGLEFCRTLQGMPDYCSIPIIFMSAVSKNISAHDCNFLAVLEKPFDISMVLSLIEQTIGSP